MTATNLVDCLFISLPPPADGRFPLNISKFHVERDHNFLDQIELDALIRYVSPLHMWVWKPPQLHKYMYASSTSLCPFLVCSVQLSLRLFLFPRRLNVLNRSAPHMDEILSSKVGSPPLAVLIVYCLWLAKHQNYRVMYTAYSVESDVHTHTVMLCEGMS